MDYYKVLGISPAASDEEIKKAFRHKARQYHPDVNQDDPKAEEKFKEINEAYEQVTKMREAGNVYGNRFSEQYDHHPNFENLFRHHQRRKNKDISLTYTITLEEAFAGVKANVKYKNDHKYAEVFVDIPVGVASGHRIFYPKRGGDRIYGEPGDLHITIMVKDHPRFSREGDNLIGTVDVDYLEAITGTKVTVECLDGTKLLLTVPSLHPTDKELRIKGKGMPSGKGFGDLNVYLTVNPPKLNDNQMEIIRDAVSKINDSKT